MSTPQKQDCLPKEDSDHPGSRRDSAGALWASFCLRFVTLASFCFRFVTLASFCLRFVTLGVKRSTKIWSEINLEGWTKAESLAVGETCKAVFFGLITQQQGPQFLLPQCPSYHGSTGSNRQKRTTKDKKGCTFCTQMKLGKGKRFDFTVACTSTKEGSKWFKLCMSH